MSSNHGWLKIPSRSCGKTFTHGSAKGSLARPAAISLIILACILCGFVHAAPVVPETPKIEEPSFPNQKFCVVEFGARPDGSDASQGLQAAIDSCHDAGGGRVVVPAGTFSTGPLQLRDNVCLVLEEGAVLRFFPERERYLPRVLSRWEGVDCWNTRPMILASRAHNVGITGQGTLDGGASFDTWWAWSKNGSKAEEAAADREQLLREAEKGIPAEERLEGAIHKPTGLRPSMVVFYESKRILVEDITIRNSPMWCLHLVYSVNITVRGIKVRSSGPNNDGCNIDSSRDVLIEGSSFATGDDCIAIKSGRNNDGRTRGIPSQRILIRDCTMTAGHGGVVVGSEISAGCSDIRVENCRMSGRNLKRAIRFKSNAVRGGTIERVLVQNLTVEEVEEAVLLVDFLYEEGAKGNHPPTVRDVLLENIVSSSSERAFDIRSFPTATVENFVLRNSQFLGLRRSNLEVPAGILTLDNVTFRFSRWWRNLVPGQHTRNPDPS